MNIKKEDIVIVGAGIAGLATSLALQRKGIRSVVVERADSIRTTGGNLTIYTNGWRALEQLGVASQLRSTAVRIHLWRDISLDDGSEENISFGKEEVRCLRRRDLMEALANELTPETIRFDHHIVGIDSDPNTSYPILELDNGGIIKAKIVIGCDGVNSVISKYLDLKPPVFSSSGSIRGVTNYVDGHGHDNEYVHMKKGNTLIGRLPMNEKIVIWYIGIQWQPKYVKTSKDPNLIHVTALQAINDFPSEIIEMVRKCDISSLSLYRFRRRRLREVALNKFRKGNVTLAGDAMHVIGPYFGQGGCSALEDAVILARCMARQMSPVMPVAWARPNYKLAFDEYVKERRPRLLSLALRGYAIGTLFDSSTSFLARIVCIVLMILFFRDINGPAQYDCGKL